MFKFLKKLFDTDMEDNKSEYDMIDLLAYECNLLTEELSQPNLSNDEQNQIIMNYLLKADTQHESINDFKEDLDWFNVTEPLSLNGELRGKVVILDFFTYCCINCMHILPDLKKIEETYSIESGLVVIGVHSAKFENERDSANILSAVQRYNITHPVVNDSHQTMWNELKVVCWPTLIILGPKANPLFVIMGEGNYETLAKYISATMNFYRNEDALKSHLLPINPAAELLPANANLKFPGKIVCSKSNENDPIPELYAISDSGNHRVIIINCDGQVLHKIGGKQPGFVDGDLKSAKFNSPQGLSFLNENILFVADTENHAVRRIDLKENFVSTIAGTGYQGNDRVGGKIGTEQEISSPWDVAVYRTRDMDMSFHVNEQSIPEKNIVLVAVAGTHQIWGVFIDDAIWWKFKKYSAGTVVVLAGNGAEENRNNSYPYNAAFAQPSGLTIGSNNELFIADSESSCVRKLSLVDGKVLPVVGGDRNPWNLFEYGDVDGKGVTAKLQHPLGVAFSNTENCVYVADTYNHKIKRVDVTTNECEKCVIQDESKNVLTLNEPGGLCLSPNCNFLYVANTNDHSIQVIDLKTMTAKLLKISFDSNPTNIGIKEQSIEFTTIKVNCHGGDLKFMIYLNYSPDIYPTDGAPQKFNVWLENSEWILNSTGNNNYIKEMPINVDISVPEGNSLDVHYVHVSFHLNLCATYVCFLKNFKVKIPVQYTIDGLDCINEDIYLHVSRESVHL